MHPPHDPGVLLSSFVLGTRARCAGQGRSPVVHFVLQENTVFTGCIFVLICHSLDMCGCSLRRRKMRVLIADDSAPVVQSLTDLLRDVPGIELAGQAGDVPEAIRCIHETKPDAVILDLQMPGGSGLDVLRAVRPNHPSLCVLICTNYPYPQYRDECLAAGANHFLDKSTEFEKIPAILRELVRSAAKATLAVGRG
ncbi:MAG: hypothetical protein DMG49_26400 [Acidobacteria bacterium]|nr:MAG: hypothetical protein DMG49_26400 [Acidobacteriota bacterium]